MLNKLKRAKLDKSSQGFTIIEIMIVLAIAGLIILIVFLAVPALQRNARNTSRKSDVANLLGAVGEFTSNAGGTSPASQADVNTVVGNTKLGYYPTANIYYSAAAPAIPANIGTGAGNATTVTTNDVIVTVGFKCGATPNVVPVASPRGVVAVYAVESGGNPIYQCEGS